MSLRIEIEQIQQAEHNVGKYASGTDYDFYSQRCWIYKAGSRHPTEYELRMKDGHRGYPEGHYECDFESLISPSRYLSPEFSAFDGFSLISISKEKFDNYYPKSSLNFLNKK
jgi:hypothetical protein